MSSRENSSEKSIHRINELIEKYDAMKKQEKMDLSSDQDLTIAIMNLISIEEHLVFSGSKTGKTHFYDLVQDVREMRKDLLKMVVEEPEGEVWCISKHLLAASMRLMEVGTKAQSMQKKQEAYALFGKAYDLYSLFWGLQMKVITPESVEQVSDGIEDSDDIGGEKVSKSKNKKSIPEEIPQTATSVGMDTAQIANRPGLMGKLGDLVRKAIDCCIE